MTASPRSTRSTEELRETTARLHGLPVLDGGPTEAGGEDARLLERSGITGRSNPLSAPLHIWLDGDRVRGWAEYPQQYEGPPGCVHGGFVAAAFDDLLGAAQTLSGQAGFTGTLTIRMVRPTPLNRRIDYEGGVSSVEGRKILTWGKAFTDAELIAEADGIFVLPPRRHGRRTHAPGPRRHGPRSLARLARLGALTDTLRLPWNSASSTACISLIT